MDQYTPPPSFAIPTQLLATEEGEKLFAQDLERLKEDRNLLRFIQVMALRTLGENGSVVFANPDGDPLVAIELPGEDHKDALNQIVADILGEADGDNAALEALKELILASTSKMAH